MIYSLIYGAHRHNSIDNVGKVIDIDIADVLTNELTLLKHVLITQTY